MLITEFDQELYEKTIREEVADRLNKLYLLLIREGKTNDLERAMRDEDFRNEQFKIHNL